MAELAAKQVNALEPTKSERGVSACSGLVSGVLAAGCCGTAPLTLAMTGIGAGSLAETTGTLWNMQLVALAGFVVGVGLVLGATYMTVRRFASRMSPLAFRRLYMQRLARTGGWAVGAYLVWFIVIFPILSSHGIQVPRPGK